MIAVSLLVFGMLVAMMLCMPCTSRAVISKAFPMLALSHASNLHTILTYHNSKRAYAPQQSNLAD